MSTYDLTGADPQFKRTDRRFKIFEANQVLEFDEPVFSDSVIVRWLKDNNDIAIVAKNVEWSIRTADRDVAAMSDAKLIDPNFNSVLIKSILSITPVPEQRTYMVEYQKLYLSASEEDYGNEGPEPTPGLMKDMLEKLDYLIQVKDPLNNITSTTIDSIHVLDEDYTGVNDENLIENELHQVNVPGGKQVIRTSAGSFYEHDLVLINSNTELTLVRGVDYEVIGLNRPKTRVAEHPSGVYDYVFVLQPYVGEIRVTYRAFGGIVSTKDINSIKDVLADVVRMLSDGQYLTETSMAYTSTILKVLSRIASLEDRIRHYVTAQHRIISDLAGRHWYSIAELYTDAQSAEVLTAAHVHLAIQSETQGWVYETHLSINLRRNHQKLRITVASSLDRNHHFSLGDYSYIGNELIPELRVVWIEDEEGNRSGAVIQIGLMMEANTPETVTVYDKSGNGSKIAIYPNVVGTALVIDDDISMPDGQVWVDGLSTSKSSRYTMCPEEGYLVFGGAIPMHELTKWTYLDHAIVDVDFQIPHINSISFYFYDRIANKVIKTTSEHHWDDNEVVADSCIFFADDLCSINYKFTGGSGSPVQLVLCGTIGSHSLINERFDLLQIVAHL